MAMRYERQQKNSIKANRYCQPDREINILLLGQTGVRKSTFINAFANYIVNDTLEEAVNDEIQVIIPSSFSYTDQDTFEEKQIAIGFEDEYETFSTEGQSSTQQCRSFCSLDQHSPVAYRLGYEYVNDRINESLVDLNQQRTVLCKISAELACFLTASQLNQEDPFLSGLIRMITEENMICQKENQNHINQKLIIELEKFKNEYQNFNAKYCKKKNKPLSDIYELIKSVNEISMVKKQLHAIRKYHKSVLTADEQNFYEESTDF
ncbi:unnamed protein product [Adineta steineri]|uniref:G domain-containing protein n=2 Tax=Adineta steineri TaxID=433720 RepID=A0A815G4H0_9BILA|nr:unnamed protein product [Adineta steineri]